MLRKKERTGIPIELSDNVLVKSNRTCCVCREVGREVQIHHIDDNPSNNSEDNLAVLCLLCHNKTLISGGFGRKLTSGQIKKFRDNWLSIVKQRSLASIATASCLTTGADNYLSTSAVDLFKHVSLLGYQDETEANLIQYIASIPQNYAISRQLAHRQNEGGTTPDMLEFNNYITNILRSIISKLLSYWPSSFFENTSIEDYVDKYIYDSALLYRSIAEPEGPGTGGTIAGPWTGLHIMKELEAKIPVLISATLPLSTHFKLEFWTPAWREACSI